VKFRRHQMPHAAPQVLDALLAGVERVRILRGNHCGPAVLGTGIQCLDIVGLLVHHT